MNTLKIYVTLQDGVINVYSKEPLKIVKIDIDDQSHEEPVIISEDTNLPLSMLITDLNHALVTIDPPDLIDDILLECGVDKYNL